MSQTVEKPQLLLKHHLKQFKLPTFLAGYERQAHECAHGGVDHVRYLLRLAELELPGGHRSPMLSFVRPAHGRTRAASCLAAIRQASRRIRAARFPVVKSLDSFDFTAIPSLNKMLVTELARGEYIIRRENIIALGNSGAERRMLPWRLASPPVSAA